MIIYSQSISFFFFPLLSSSFFLVRTRLRTKVPSWPSRPPTVIPRSSGCRVCAPDVRRRSLRAIYTPCYGGFIARHVRDVFAYITPHPPRFARTFNVKTNVMRYPNIALHSHLTREFQTKTRSRNTQHSQSVRLYDGIPEMAEQIYSQRVLKVIVT